MAIHEIATEKQVEFARRMIQSQLTKEVEDYIRSEVMPELNKKIKDFAKSAVQQWAIQVQSEKSMTAFSNVDNIMVKFTEHIVNKVEQMPPPVKEVK